MTEQQEEKPRWWSLAKATLTAAARQDYAEMNRVGQELADLCTVVELSHVMCAWLDTVIQLEGVNAEQFEGVAWVNADTGAVSDADGVPPPQRFAGRLFMARLNMDQATFEALMRSMTTDEEWTRNVSAVLMQCAGHLRRLGRRDVTRG